MLRFSKIYLIFSGLLVAVSIISLLFWGLNLGIEFTGGSLVELEFSGEVPSPALVRGILEEFGLADFQIQPQGENGLVIRTLSLAEQEHQALLDSLKQGLPEFSERSFQSIGPVIGQELKQKAFFALGLGLLAVVIYIAWAFRRAGALVRPWQYALVVLVTLLHDVVITIGFFAVLGHFWQVQVGAPFVAAVLTVLGYSVNDTIVVFDRIRERVLEKDREKNFEILLAKSVRETLRRSLITSLSTLVVLAALLIWGAASLFNFSLALMVGIGVGTYSSLLLAPPLLLIVRNLR